MNKLQELEKADRDLKELGAQVDSIKYHLKHLEENIALLNGVKVQFDQNIETLRRDKIIASVSEYKKIKADLTTVVGRLYIMRIDMNNHNVALRRAEKMLFECREKYVSLLKNQDAQIIRGKFGTKRDVKKDC